MPLNNDSIVSAITYPEGGRQRIYAFVNGGNHLYVNYWDGAVWRWADQGGVPGGFQGSLKMLNMPSAITYRESGSQRIYVFLVGDDGVGSNVRLHVNYWDGSNWHWADQGAPLGRTLKQIPSAITYQDGNGQRIYVFVADRDHDLQVNYWDGSQWHWADQGHPALINPSVNIGGQGTVTYADSGQRRIYAFVPIADRLRLNYWDGAHWHWADQGAPFPPGSNVSFTTLDSATTYLEGGTRHIHEFIVGTDQRLYCNYWNGHQWDWGHQGSPANTNVDGMIGAIDYWDDGGKHERIYTFVTGYQQPADRRLYVNYWDGSQWRWADQGKPASLGSAMLNRVGSVITFQENGRQLIYAFVTASNGHLYVNYWDGNRWNWADQGQP